MDTTIIVGVIIGSVVAIILVFGKTVFRVAWTGNNRSKSKKRAQNQSEVISTINPAKVLLDEGQKEDGKGLESRNKSNDFDSLVDRDVFACDGALIGSISSLQNELMVIYSRERIRFEIPTYYIRQKTQTNVLVDISARDLQHYKPQATIIHR